MVETVKGYAAHESGTLDKVIQARAKAMNASGVAAKSQAEGELSGTLKSLFALSEAYPALRAVEAFTSLQGELTDTENKIQAARRFYNSNVMMLNTKIEVFPTNLIAGSFGFTKADFFQADGVERDPVVVKF